MQIFDSKVDFNTTIIGKLPAFQWNQLQKELRAFFNAAGITPTDEDFTQFTQCLYVLFYKKAEINTMISGVQSAITTLSGNLTTETTNRTSADTALQTLINAINGKIPSAASSSNQLADKDFVNSSIQNNAANRVYASTAQGDFASRAAIQAATAFYNAAGAAYTPSNNDYTIVDSDEGAPAPFTNGQTRWKWTGNPATLGYDYGINETPFTSAQNAAINSGITAALIATFRASENARTIATPQADATQITQGTYSLSAVLTKLINNVSAIFAKFGNYVLSSSKNQANGVAALNSEGLLDSSVIPGQTIYHLSPTIYTTDTAAGTQIKVINENVLPAAGDFIGVKFTNGNTANNPILQFTGQNFSTKLAGAAAQGIDGAKCGANGFIFYSYYAQGFNQFGGNANALPTPTTYNIASHADFTALQALIRKTNHNTPIIVNIAQSFTTSSRITLGSVPAMITFEFLNSAILTYNGTGDNIFFSENSFVRINNCNIVGTGTNALRCARGGTIEVVGTCNISGSPTALYAYYNGQIVLSNTAGLTLTGNTNNYPASCIFTEEKVLRTKTDAERFLDVIFAKNPDDPTSKAWKEPAIPQIGDVVNGVLQHPDHSGGAGA